MSGKLMRLNIQQKVHYTVNVNDINAGEENKWRGIEIETSNIDVQKLNLDKNFAMGNEIPTYILIVFSLPISS